MSKESVLQYEYLNWLTIHVENNQKHRPLIRFLHEKEFVWIEHMDENRAADTNDVRLDFVRINQQYTIEELNNLLPFPSVLEVLIALSRRMEFQTLESARHWARVFISHLGLDEYMGRLTSNEKEEIDGILNRWLFRQYSHNGEGGLFPLRYPNQNQREVELWYQMAAYIIENQLV